MKKIRSSDVVDMMKEAIINNSTIECDDKDCLFGEVDFVEREADKLHIRFCNGNEFKISVEEAVLTGPSYLVFDEDDGTIRDLRITYDYETARLLLGFNILHNIYDNRSFENHTLHMFRYEKPLTEHSAESIGVYNGNPKRSKWLTALATNGKELFSEDRSNDIGQYLDFLGKKSPTLNSAIKYLKDYYDITMDENGVGDVIICLPYFREHINKLRNNR